MTADAPTDGNLADEQQEKEAQVLKREGLEEELMDDEDSDAGEEIDDAEDDEEELSS